MVRASSIVCVFVPLNNETYSVVSLWSPLHGLLDFKGSHSGVRCVSIAQALVVDEKKFQYILRILNTNVNGKDKVMYALTKIKGIGRRFANLICKKAGIDMNKRYAPLPVVV